ncbi:hypothetical protein RSOLAG1IB_06364 [Rhizoctonia solani AG-1 IB]|uniref:Uncharacterized protein n=1 Tax=Thanatephorus cucumeris (strain AG1-IB / isolate 7/3/14) TaxID=1108050 RepID=A0A0B7F7I6_THACB|nr:hypothetical protein RSOLAG1IB_06364 [Rhizoctonia solani AG-1 IB]
MSRNLCTGVCEGRASNPSHDHFISHISFHNSLSIVLPFHHYRHKQRSLHIYTVALPVLSPQNSFEYENFS